MDQIAAGEVVERPASVVKELVENAIDAGATRIRVEIRDGGRAWIAVTDDGVGMSPGDARLAVQRHATSKVATSDDLARIASFGFRGEALPAIASVSRLRLLTRMHDSDEAFELTIEAGQVIRERAAGGPVGTRIEVADLFAGVPARRKFLKKPGTEWGHIADWLGRLALALPGVHFEVRRDDRDALVWPSAADPLDRIAVVLSEEDAAALIAVEWESATGHVQAYLSPPERVRASANALYLFVNNRPVRDRVLRHALLNAYRDLLPRGRYPTAIVFLTVPLESIDVNVHPAKWEVRFTDPKDVHQLIRATVRRAMESRAWLGGVSAPGAAAGQSGWQRRTWTSAGGDDAPAVAERPPEAWQEADPVARAAGPHAQLDLRTPAAERMEFSALPLVGQLMATYLVLDGPDGLLLVDQHAAHERVLYEGLRAQWLARGIACQRLLMPITTTVDPLAAVALGDAADLVERLGFEVEPFGEGAVVIRGVPAAVADRDPETLLRDLTDELQGPGLETGEGPDESRRLEAVDRLLATLACHSARRAGDRLGIHEQRSILEGLDSIPWAPCCPHGRPVSISIDRFDIERRFGRR